MNIFCSIISIPLWYDYKRVPLTINEVFVSFQFHYGTIITNLQRTGYDAIFLFQFHYGTIITPKGFKGLTKTLRFQFHYGTIITAIMTVIKTGEEYFNSTMVRL